MKKYIIKRLLLSVVIIFGVSIFIFVLLQKQPGNPYLNSLNPSISKEQAQEILVQKGYYDPLPIKYFKWLKGFLMLDFGYSIQHKTPVLTLILERLPYTLMLTLPALILSLLLSIPIGMYFAYKPNAALAKIGNVLTLIGISIPTFFFAILLIKWLAFDWALFPISGTGRLAGSNLWWANLHHSVLPILTLTIIQMAGFIRYIQGYISNEMNQKYMDVAQGYGLSKWEALKKHALPAILPQLVTLVFMEIPTLFSGALITETIFVWPGIGKLNYDAVAYRDYPLIMGLLIITVFIILISNLLADILAAKLNPVIQIQ